MIINIFFPISLCQDLIRQYDLKIHTDLPDEKIFTGEIAQLKSLVNQKP